MMKRIRKLLLSIMLIMAVVLSSTNISFAEESKEEISSTRQFLGETVYAGNSDGYSKKEKISKNNPHYGWKIGDFYLNGFTRIAGNSKEPIVLKNAGDKVKLSFVLSQDINKLNGKEGIKIGSDKDGYDEAFGITKTDFGQGMLIIQKTDYQGKKEEPVKHKNYLKGVKLNADTEVELCEEGDYEVALDYQIDIDKSWYDYLTVWNQYTYDYRIHFKFSVRNGNCMVYPFDVNTKAELTDTAVTENGFYLDFAKSRYLDVDIRKQILNEGATGLVEDTRFNKPAADGEKFTEEGVYIIEAKNKYTDQTTEKTIYVGKNDMLKAYVASGLQLEEIKKQLNSGATVGDDGSLNYDNIKVGASNGTTTEANKSSKEDEGISVNIDVGYLKKLAYKGLDFAKRYPIPVTAGIIVVIVLLVVLIMTVKKKIKSAKERRRKKREQKKRLKEERKNRKNKKDNVGIVEKEGKKDEE